MVEERKDIQKEDGWRKINKNTVVLRLEGYIHIGKTIGRRTKRRKLVGERKNKKRKE